MAAIPTVLFQDTFLLEHTVEQIRDRMIVLALRKCKTRQAAAKRLGIGKASLYRWLEKHPEHR